jgi:hypothetical protein
LRRSNVAIPATVRQLRLGAHAGGASKNAGDVVSQPVEAATPGETVSIILRSELLAQARQGADDAPWVD